MSTSAFPYGTMIPAAGAPVGNVVISGDSSYHYDSGGLVYAGIIWDDDGSCNDLGPGLAENNGPFTSGEWWDNEPVTDVGDYYDVREENHLGGTWFSQAASEGVWVQMGSNRIWRVRQPIMGSPGASSASGTFEIRDTGSGSALDSANYGATAEN